jgi:tetratricopeptide (TPR) repeat protein
VTRPNKADNVNMGEKAFQTLHRKGAFRRRSVRIVIWIVLVLVLFGGGLWGFVWWFDRPLNMIETHLESGEFDEALSLSRRFLRENPNDIRGQMLEVRSLVGLNRFDAAEEIVLRIIREVGGFPKTVPNLRAVAEILIYRKQWSRAEGFLQELLEIAPDDPDALNKITITRTRFGDFTAAMTSAKRYARIPGHEARGFFLVATIYHDTGRGREAIDAWKTALMLNPELKDMQVPPNEFLYNYGDGLLSEGQAEEAIGVLERSVALRETAEAYVTLGNAYLQSQKPHDAERSWRRAVDLDPLNVKAREELAQRALKEGDSRKAIEWMQPLIRSNRYRGQGAYLLMRAYAFLNDEAESQRWRKTALSMRSREARENLINQVLRDLPDAFWSRFVRAHRFASSGNWAQARAMVDDLMKSHPEQPLLKELDRAIRNRGGLPSLDRIPINAEH